MPKINCAFYTREYQVSHLNLGLTKEQMGKKQERDKNMAKIMTQMDQLMKHVMRSGSKVVNAISYNSGVITPRAYTLGGTDTQEPLMAPSELLLIQWKTPSIITIIICISTQLFNKII